jgi:heme exporter protein A
MELARRFSGSDIACRRGGRVLFCDLAFLVEPGELMLLAGPNGSGKSSLMRAMAGLLPLEAGEIRWGDAPAGEGFSGFLSYLGHADACKPTLTVAENLGFHADLVGRADAVEAALERVGLGKLKHRPGRQLSSGQRRRLSLARVIAAARPLWLLDEPTVGLDQDGRAVVADLLSAHLAAGGLAIVATHQELGAPAARSLNPADFRA